MERKQRRITEGAVTLEAALLMPVFIYCIVNLLTLFDAVRVHTLLYAALHQAGREIAVHAFDVRFAAQAASEYAGITPREETRDAAEPAANILSTAYAAGRVRTYLETHGRRLSCLEDGIDGITYFRSGFFSDGDIIDLVAACKIRPLLRVFPFTSFSTEVRYYAHAWTGYGIPASDTGEAAREETVYVTKTGTVWHASPSCTYLKPSVRTTGKDALKTLRNESGGKYHPCEVCGGGTGSMVTITDYGDRYHAGADCPALKRNVRAVARSTAAGLKPCGKCGTAH